MLGRKYRRHVLFTCLLPCSEVVVGTLTRLAMKLHESGVRLVLFAPDADYGLRLDSAYADFEVLEGGLAAYAAPGFYPESALCDSYSRRLADVDANWGSLADAASLERSRTGIPACRQAAEMAFDDYKPVVALLWSAALFPASRIWRNVAQERGVLSYNVERGFLPGTWMFDSEGMLGHSDALISPALRGVLRNHSGNLRFKQYRDWYLATRPRKYGDSGIGGDAIRNSVGQRRRVVCVFGGLDTGGDGVGLLAASGVAGLGFVSGSSMLAALQQLDLGSDVSILFKAHPGSAGRFPVGRHGRVEVVSADCDPIALIQMADVVVAGTTSLAYEAVLLDRSVVLTCQGPMKGIVPVALDLRDLEAEISSSMNNPCDERELEKRHAFIDGLLTHYLFASDVGAVARPMQEFVEHLVEVIGSVEPPCVSDESQRPKVEAGFAPTQTVPLPTLFGATYVDLGRGFNEQDVHRWVVFRDTGVDWHIVPVPLGTRALRIDPADLPCVVRLVEVAWLDRDGHLIYREHLGDLAQRCSASEIRFRQVGQGDVLDLICTGGDPNFVLPITDELGDRLAREALQLRLTYSAWSYAKGVSLAPGQFFDELHDNVAAVTAAVHAVEGRQEEALASLRDLVLSVQEQGGRSDDMSAEAHRHLVACLKEAQDQLRLLVATSIPALADESRAMHQVALTRFAAGLNEVWQRLHTQLGDAAHTILSAQHGASAATVSAVEGVASALSEKMLALHHQQLGELKQQQAHAVQLMHGQQRIVDELLTQAVTLQEELKRQASDLTEYRDSLAMARRKLAVLSSHSTIRLVRALCRLPKDIFSA